MIGETTAAEENRGSPRPSRTAARPPVARVRILDEDPDLGAGLSEADMVAATRALVAPVLKLNGPRWEPPELQPAAHDAYGILILDGLLGRRLRVGRAVATELLSCGDILRPWEQPLLSGLTEFSLDWRVFHPARVAILDRNVTTLIGRRPQLIVNFSSRLLRRARTTAYLMAISHQTRVENRLMETLWYLANSWGRVTSRGVRIPFRITHEVLSEILGAQRPSVTTAFRKLVDQELVTREPDGTFMLLHKAMVSSPPLA